MDKGRRSLTQEQAGEEIVKLLRQIGTLENRNANLETAIEAISAKCAWRSLGYCDLRCGGWVFCNVKGLTKVDWGLMGHNSPSPQPSPLKGEGEAERSTG